MGFTNETEHWLRAAGWHPGRNVDVAAWRMLAEESGLVMHAAAERFLAEFGGLVVPVSGQGVSCAREPFDLDPSAADGESDRYIGWGERIGRSLFPIGAIDGGRYFLAIDELSEVYVIVNFMARCGQPHMALEGLVRGIAPEYLTEPGEI
ncbi:SUKH-3 domain-containing protein [Yinghuangia sp. YIM S09857]|uniref:SUKH-3 domain-containing protein n=1 Tax=Yinghuangia sp. YIM S09857 TaxID=3436929 RepID=UPI003F52936A